MDVRQPCLIASTVKRSAAVAALLACFAGPALAGETEQATSTQATPTQATQATQATMDELTDQLIAGTLSKSDSVTASDTDTIGPALPGDPVMPKANPKARSPYAGGAGSPYGPQVSLHPVAKNSFTIRLKKDAVHGAPGNDGGFMLRTAGYVIAHDVCGKFQMGVSSVAFRTNGEGDGAGVIGTVVCKHRKDKAINS